MHPPAGNFHIGRTTTRRWPHRVGRSSERACDGCTDESDRGHGGWHRGRASSASWAILRAQKISDRHPLLHRFQFGDEFAKTLRENSVAPRQIKSNARARNVMVQEVAPTGPKLWIEQTVNVMVMNRLERFQELMGRVKKARLLIG